MKKLFKVWTICYNLRQEWDKLMLEQDEKLKNYCKYEF